MLIVLPKDKIQRNFDRASATYDRVAVVQRKCAHQLVKIIQQQYQNFDPQVILDLGAGTGFMTQALLPHYSKSQYYLNDMSPQMILKAQKNLQDCFQIEYILTDMASLSYKCYKPDLLISNLSFQWIKDVDLLIQKVFECTRVLAFTCLLSNTFQEWGKMFERLDLPPPIFSYWSQKKWHDFLKGLDPKKIILQSKKFILTFLNARDFMIYLRQLGANQSSQVISLKALRQVLTTYDQPFSITYQVLFVVMAQK